MEIHGQFDLLGNAVKNIAIAEGEFSHNPVPGQFTFKNKTLYFCVEVADLPVWVPLTSNLQMRRFIQPVPATEWTVVHGLNTSGVLVQCYDLDGNWVIPDEINTSVFNTVTVTFNVATAGSCIIMRGNEEGNVPVMFNYEQVFTNLSTWTINHMLGYNPVINLYVNDQLVQPNDLVYTSSNQAVAIFSSPQTGLARCV